MAPRSPTAPTAVATAVTISAQFGSAASITKDPRSCVPPACPAAADAAHEQGEEAVGAHRRVGRVLGGEADRVDDAKQIVDVHLGAHLAGCLRTLEERSPGLTHRFADRRRAVTVVEHRDHRRRGKAPAAHRALHLCTQPRCERVAGRWRIEQGLGLCLQSVELVREYRLDERAASGKVPIQRADADAGATRDLLE